jgi:hypothetical protein
MNCNETKIPLPGTCARNKKNELEKEYPGVIE